MARLLPASLRFNPLPALFLLPTSSIPLPAGHDQDERKSNESHMWSLFTPLLWPVVSLAGGELCKSWDALGCLSLQTWLSGHCIKWKCVCWGRIGSVQECETCNWHPVEEHKAASDSFYLLMHLYILMLWSPVLPHVVTMTGGMCWKANSQHLWCCKQMELPFPITPSPILFLM